AFPYDALDAEMPRIVADAPALHFRFGVSAAFDARLTGWLDAVRARARAGVAAPGAAFALGPLLADMRLVKDSHEQAPMRRAAD
ncbi:Xaa-Pro aminopeptidase, partial [Burkholderia pseudomallei]